MLSIKASAYLWPGTLILNDSDAICNGWGPFANGLLPETARRDVSTVNYDKPDTHAIYIDRFIVFDDDHHRRVRIWQRCGAGDEIPA